jgi:hypothetical protein
MAAPETGQSVGDLKTINTSILLILNLVFLYVLTLNGLARYIQPSEVSHLAKFFVISRSMSDLAGLTKPSGVIPRGNWLFICCGLTTVLSGYFSGTYYVVVLASLQISVCAACTLGPPILVSPESAAGIKAGAKTGLSTVVCGILFGISVFFWPLFKAVPAAGTAPLLIIVGTW